MGDGPKLAIAILVMWVAMVFFFFAFHPGGVVNVSNPAQMIQWLMNEFANITGGNQTTGASTAASITGANQELAYPGYQQSTSDIGNVNPGGVQLA